jgi:hypothetical protein
MHTVLLPPGGYPISVKCISYISCHISYMYHIIYHIIYYIIYIISYIIYIISYIISYIIYYIIYIISYTISYTIYYIIYIISYIIYIISYIISYIIPPQTSQQWCQDTVKPEPTYTDSKYWEVQHVLVTREIRLRTTCYTIAPYFNNKGKYSRRIH